MAPRPEPGICAHYCAPTSWTLYLSQSSDCPDLLKTLNILFTSTFFFEKIVLSPRVSIRSSGGGCILVKWGRRLYALHAYAIACIFVLIGSRIESGNRGRTDNKSGE